MADSFLAVTYDSLRELVGQVKGLNTTVSSWTAAQAAEVDRIIASGLRKFYWPRTPDDQPPHEWSFLRRDTSLSLTAGTYSYDLPDDFVSFVGQPVVNDVDGGAMEPIDVDVLLSLRARKNLSGVPVKYALRQKSHDATVGTRWEVLLYPIPREAWTVLYRYVFEPEELTNVNVYPLGGMAHGETIQAAVMSAWECINGDYAGVHSEEFARQLAVSMRIDRGQRP